MRGWQRKVLIASLTLLVVFVAATARIIVWPAQGMPAHVNAIVMFAANAPA